jgi:hypothetical protein
MAPQIDDDRRSHASALGHEKHDRHFIRRKRLLLNYHHLTLGYLVIVPDREVKAPQAIA